MEFVVSIKLPGFALIIKLNPGSGINVTLFVICIRFLIAPGANS